MRRAIRTFGGDKKVLEVFLHQDHTPDGLRFYMWIQDPDATVKNTCPELKVGYSLGEGGAVYISKEKAGHWNGMFMIHEYDGGDYPSDTIVWFGGWRPNDINIRLPKGYTAKFHVNNVRYDEKEWRRTLEDEAERETRDYLTPPGVSRPKPPSKTETKSKE